MARRSDTVLGWAVSFRVFRSAQNCRRNPLAAIRPGSVVSDEFRVGVVDRDGRNPAARRICRRRARRNADAESVAATRSGYRPPSELLARDGARAGVLLSAPPLI